MAIKEVPHVPLAIMLLAITGCISLLDFLFSERRPAVFWKVYADLVGDPNKLRDTQKLEPIHWEMHDGLDAVSKVTADCCPVARAMYSERYANIGYRCCTGISQQLLPLQSVGGLGWNDDRAMFLKNTSITIVGDSLAEQHFIALLCFAWATPNHYVRDLRVVRPGKGGKNGSHGVTWSAIVEPLGTRVDWVRNNWPTMIDSVDYTSSSFLILGGWHHGKLSTLKTYLSRVAELRSFSATTLVVEALPVHFPGGRYRPGGAYPPAKTEITGAACSQNSSIADPDINPRLRSLTSSVPGLELLEVFDLYRVRGDAHIGVIPDDSKFGRPGRDCMHWCVANGVLDALARATLMALHRLETK